MKPSMRYVVLAAAMALAVASLGGPALAQDKETVIKNRQALMKDQLREWLAIKNYVEGKADQPAALSAAESLAKSTPTVPNYFPPGTDGPSPDGKWATKPEVWTEHDKFLAANKKVADQVAVLDAAIRSGDKPKVEAAFKDLNICNACHDTFRAKLQ
jgi:cytochrome c556